MDYLSSSEKPRNVKLSNTIFNALNNYVETKENSNSSENANSNKSARELLAEAFENISNKTTPQPAFSEIGFLGRENELSELENFLISDEHRIFALHGVPMIGKTKLVNHFLDIREIAKTYNLITVELSPNPDNPEQRIKDEIFGGKDFNDFSDFSSNTLLVIRNFEETLKWKGNPRELHDIDENYPNIKAFLDEATKKNTIKLILESRFQIHFEAVLADRKTKVRTLPLEGIEAEKFWKFYESKEFTREQFETLCRNFDNHTGLLALAYNQAEWLYEDRLIEAVNRPKLTTRLLWDFVEYIINRLEKREIWLLCALTFLQESVKPENIYRDFLSLPDFEDELQIDDSFDSLAKKLLIQLEHGLYNLNPYIREVCYTFLKARRRLEMQTINTLPYFKEHGKSPIYDELRQAREKGDFRTFFRLIKENRQKRNYKEVHNHLENALLDPQFRKVVVLNEIGITYREEGKLEEAIETLERAVKLGNIHSYTELAICYRENHQLDKAIETLKGAKEKYPSDVKTLNELGICYRESHQLDKAIETLEGAVEDYPNDLKILNELGICYRESHQLDKAIETLERAVKLGNEYSYTELAICYRENHQLDKAIETLKGAKEKYPNNVKILNELGICYRESHQLDKAIETLEGAVEDYPDNVKILSVLAGTYKEKGELEKAYETAKEGVKSSNWKDGILIKQFRELERELNQQKQEKKKALRVFISYSHSDADIKEKLKAHLAPLRGRNKISTWYDGLIMPGEDWDSKIKSELENADIILLLISADFNNSEYIRNNEVNRAIERDSQREAKVIPIFCRSCVTDDMPYAKLQGLPRDKSFIKSPDNDEKLTEVAISIGEVVKKLLE